MNYNCPTVTFLALSTQQFKLPLHLKAPLVSTSPTHKPIVSVIRTFNLFTSSRGPIIRCTLSSEEGNSSTWKKWIPDRPVFGADGVLRSIANATSSPICQFIPAPTTFLHSIDPRIKLVWLLAFILLPARSNIYVRFAVVLHLALLSVLFLPKNVWTDQLGRVTLLSGVLFIMLALSADGVSPMVSPRTPPSAIMDLPNIPSSFQGYSYIIMKLGPLQLTRKGLSIASTSACLTFTIFQSASLCLTTTSPGELASALRWFMLPLKRLGVPVAEIILTLLLSLRFINLVFDEVRNVALGILSRRIDWQQLTTMETIDVFISYIRRVFKNILCHAEQIAQAMVVRGFRGDSETHKLYFFRDPGLGMADAVCLIGLLVLTGVVLMSERLVI
ncbi:hypothetical protein Dimus_029769 [Dionaea muscipula]